MYISDLKYQISSLPSVWTLHTLHLFASFLFFTILSIRLTYYLIAPISYKNLAATHLAIFMLAFTWLPTSLSTTTDFLVSSFTIVSVIKFGAKYMRPTTPRFWVDYLLSPVLVGTLIYMLAEVFELNSVPFQPSRLAYHLSIVSARLSISTEFAWKGIWIIFWGWVAAREVPEYKRPLALVLVIRVLGAVQIKLEETEAIEKMK